MQNEPLVMSVCDTALGAEPTPKLGKLPSKSDPRTLRLEKYFDPATIPVPDTFDYMQRVSEFPMWLNDRVGDCAIASPAGLIATWTANKGAQQLVSDTDVLRAYSAVSGYNPQTGQNENGCVMLDVLKYWKNVGIGGHKLGAFGDVGIADMIAVKAACWLCEGLNIGLQLPAYCLNSSLWLTPSNVIAGGHAIDLLGFDANGNFIGVSWGRVVSVSPAFLMAQCDELHFGISSDQFDAAGAAANHLDIVAMQKDVATVAAFDTPVIVPPPIVVPPPVPAPPPPGPTPGPAPILPPLQPTQRLGHLFWGDGFFGWYTK
jgi:hypothetical protein